MGRSRSINFELTRRRIRQRLAADTPWLYFGCAGSLLWFGWFFSQGWEIGESAALVRHAAQLLAVWFAAFSTLYILARWFYARDEAEAEELAQLPLSQAHWYVQRAVDIALVPLAFLLLSLPLFSILCMFHASPYGEGAERYVLRWGEEDSWAFFENSWTWRVFFIHLNLAYCALLPAGLAVVLREALRTAWLRIILFAAIAAGLYLASERVRFEFLELAYRKTTPLDRWPFVVLLLLVIAVPLLLGLLGRRGRAWLLSSALALTAAFAALPYLQYTALGVPFTAWLRDTLGDTRFALALFFGHLNPLENQRLLFDSYVSALLFNDTPPLPKRLAVWVFSGIYPLAFALWLILGPGVGYFLRGQPARDDS